MKESSTHEGHRSNLALIVVGLFFFALAPRVLNGGTFLTIDEAYHWFERAESFLRAMHQGDYRGTFLVGHPGVTTMWLGAAGIRLHQLLADAGVIDLADAQAHRVLLRLPVAVVTSLSVAWAYPLLRPIVGAQVALLAAMLWASEPFLVAHAQLLHTDALLTSFMTLAILAALRAFVVDRERAQRVGWAMLIASGIATGLALLTKSPSVLLLPFTCLIAIVAERRSTGIARRLPVVPLLLWGGVAALVCFVLWPALWVEPVQTIVDVARQARDEGGTAHDRGNFFLGQTVDDPGPLFYPVALALRMTPWTLIGFALGLASLLRLGATQKRMVLGLIVLYVLVFLGALTLLPKKFDRYALPAFPMIGLLAAVGLAEAIGWLTMRTRRWLRLPLPRATIVLLFLIMGANLLWYHPYELAYYNPLLGGGRVAARMVPVGWGEGYDQAGAYLMTTAGCDEPVAVRFDPVLAPYVCSPLVPLSWIDQKDRARYAVLTVDQVQRGLEPEATARLREHAPLLHTVRIHGIDYASIYEVVPPLPQQIEAEFGAELRLRAYDIDATDVAASGNIVVTLQWEAALHSVPDEMLFIHVLAADGQLVGQTDVPLSGAHADDWTRRHVVTFEQVVPVQPELPRAPYWVAVGVYRPQDGTRLPLRAPAQKDGPSDGADALVLPPIDLR